MHRRSIDLLFNNKERKRVERASNGWAVHESTKKKKEAAVEKSIVECCLSRIHEDLKINP